MPAILKKGTSLGQSAVAMLLRRYSKKQAKPQLIAINRELSLSPLSQTAQMYSNYLQKGLA